MVTSKRVVSKPKAAAQPAPPAPAPAPGKTAVVVIHGIGEQTPLETLRGFVETVYQRDRALASLPVDKTGLLNIAIVPDDVTGSAELRRITTLKDGPQKRTDFFEFYWADIMDGTPLDMVTGWIRTLLLRSPLQLPRSAKVRWAWAIMWVFAIIILGAGLVTAYPESLQSIEAWGPLPQIGDRLAAARPFIAAGLVGLAILLRLLRVVKLKGLLVVAGLGVALFLVPAPLADSLRFWAAALTALVGWSLHAVVTPFAGDVVRYVRATPSTVERRRLVRERGLALLEALHQKRRNGPPLEAFATVPADNPPLYDRIVIVGHSLGTIIGYDILQLFWDKHGPTHHQSWNPAAEGVQDALKACDAYVIAAWPDRGAAFDRAGFAAAQARLLAVLAKQSPGWRISDFITLGSPLAHAEFLLVDNADQVRQAAEERRFATAPPHPDPLQLGSMLFSRTGLAQRADGSEEPLYPHFAAQFAAVKWTNIFDEATNPLLGDLISGSLKTDFGSGIEEHGVSIRRLGWPGFLGRIFTHTRYWSWDLGYEPSAANVEAAAVAMAKPDEAARRELLWHNVPEHIRRLRLALRLES